MTKLLDWLRNKWKVSMETANLRNTKKATRQQGFKPPPEAPSGFKASELDAMYNDIDKDEDIGETPSVLIHLLSQVTIGMDLTKVTLPTHILERRSLLEFYASFFTHADLFISIPSYGTPRERMVALVRWYMSAYHVSLKPKRPKKPYNPVLGEIFKCHYELGDSERTTSVSAVSKGTALQPPPRPSGAATATAEPASSDLMFIAEQVCHQPPISAFYAECPSKNISCQAHIHTKTQFRGTYATIQLAGRGTVTLHSHNEEYECTFPTVYIRSIFATPWMEFGDSISIACPSTDMSCEVKFVTKGVFGGEVNSIKGHIKQKNETIAKLTGNWTELVHLAHAVKGKRTKPDFDEKEVLFSVASAKHHKMRVRSVDKQEAFESRRTWANVTYHLFKKNLELATMYKNKIEETQRHEKLNRDKTSATWKPREFTPANDGCWLYRNRLESRLNDSV